MSGIQLFLSWAHDDAEAKESFLNLHESGTWSHARRSILDFHYTSVTLGI